MDGFQAVQAIKADAQTATIPLMMYTSQEGELYVSQARALGAIGVLPKTVRPVDVSRVLYQLHLLPDRRQPRSALFDAAAAAAQPPAPAPSASAGTGRAAAQSASAPSGEPPGAVPGIAALPAAALSELQGSLRQSLQQLVRDQLGEQRRFMLATFEAFARRMSGEFREAAAKAPSTPAVEAVAPESPAVAWWPIALTALLAAVPSVILGVLYWQSAERNAALARELAESRAQLTASVARQQQPADRTAAAAPEVAAPAPATGAAAPLAPLGAEPVPYGETPLASGRLERLRGLAATLEAQQFRGRIVVESFTGDFCLSGNAGEGFALADPALATRDCDVVGNPFDDALSPAQRQSLAFANFAASLRQRTGGAIVVETQSLGRRNAEAYPEQGERSTAGDWNAVAGRNNRVEFRLVPAG
jgi:CheY-like chemotaxis protein